MASLLVAVVVIATITGGSGRRALRLAAVTVSGIVFVAAIGVAHLPAVLGARQRT